MNNSELTGIKEECVLNEVPHYHCAKNIYCDVCHDIYQGMLKYDLCSILYNLIVVRGYFSLETLCERIEGFDYGPAEKGNKPPTSHITKDKLESCSLNLSASEMLCLGRYLGEMIGDLVPLDNKIWKFYKIVREILEIVTCPFFQPGVDKYLETLVSEHHELFLLYFGNLKPKHHFMLHYSLLLKQNGPLVLLSALMCERNHRKGKLYASVSNSRINFPLSVAIKYQLMFCERLMRYEPVKTPVKFTGAHNVICRDLHHFELFSNSLPFDAASIVFSVKSVEVHGTRYAHNMILVLRVDSMLPTFAKIAHIIVNEDQSILFIVNAIYSVYYLDHICAYEVQDSNEWLCLKHSDLQYYIPLWQRTAADSGKQVVSLKHIL